MGNKIFLGGTRNGMAWRREFIDAMRAPVFNSITAVNQEEIESEKEICNIHIYVITSENSNVVPIAEAIESVHVTRRITMFYILEDGFDGKQLSDVRTVMSIINKHGGFIGIGKDIQPLIGFFECIGE